MRRLLFLLLLCVPLGLLAWKGAGILWGEAHPASSPVAEPVVPPEPWEPGDVDTTRTRIVIEKAKRRLHLLEARDTLESWPIVMGPETKGDKRMQGDGRTPEGVFHLHSKYPHDKWNYFLWIDYPNDESYARFNRRKAAGEIPDDAKIGGEIGIHGTPAGYDYLIDENIDWTLGCISVTRDAIERIYPVFPVGGEIHILP